MQNSREKFGILWFMSITKRLMGDTKSSFFSVVMALRRLIYVRRDNRAIKNQELHYRLRTIKYRSGGVLLKTSLIRSTNGDSSSRERGPSSISKGSFQPNMKSFALSHQVFSNRRVYFKKKSAAIRIDVGKIRIGIHIYLYFVKLN